MLLPSVNYPCLDRLILNRFLQFKSLCFFFSFMAGIQPSGRLLISKFCFESEFQSSVPEDEVTKVRFVSFAGSNAVQFDWRSRGVGLRGGVQRTSSFRPLKVLADDCSAIPGKKIHNMSTTGKSTNILWHESPIEKPQRQELLQQKGCVIWITGLSGSGKSSLACALSWGLHLRGKLTYILDGDNVRHGLNSDLSFKAEDRAENVRRIGEVAKLFADAGVICIASLISPFRKDRDTCRALLPEGNFIEVFLDIPLNVCEARDPKGLYKLARAGKIKGFTGIDDSYERPMNCEITLQQTVGKHQSPTDLAQTVISYLEEKEYLQA